MRWSGMMVMVVGLAALIGCGKTTKVQIGSGSGVTRDSRLDRSGRTVDRGDGGHSRRDTRQVTPPVEPGPVLESDTRAVSTKAKHTRRTYSTNHMASRRYGAPRGRSFEDIIPVGARIQAVHVATDGAQINGFWFTHEIQGVSRDTPCRGVRNGRIESFKLKGKEKIVGIHGYGDNGIDQLIIATNLRLKSLGDPHAAPPGDVPGCAMLSTDQKRDFIGIGFTGRADTRLRFLILRLEVAK